MGVEKYVLLKSNVEVLIREVTSKDAPQLLQLKLSYLKNTRTIPLFESEYGNSIADELALIHRYITQSNSFLLVAEYNGTLIGNIDLTGNQRKKIFHTAVIGMGISPEWQQQGLGSFLLQNTIDWAHKNVFLKIVWLEVYASNLGGIALYTKKGFKETGRIVSFSQEKDQFVDKITMSLTV